MAPVKDPAAGAAAKKEGMGRAALSADPAWLRAVESAIHYVATHQRELTTDDVWERLALVSTTSTRERRSMGPAMKSAQGRGWVEITNSWRASERPSRHRAPVQVWRSRIYRVQARREHTT